MDALRVVVRVRAESCSDSCIVINNDRISILSPKVERAGPSSAETNATFKFDRIFDTSSSQDDVFEYAQPLLDECLKGFTVTVFAFGMTGSGKTYTIGGNQEEPGIVPKAVAHVFDNLAKLSAHSPDQVAVVCITYVELYNNQLHDLLADSFADSGSLKIHEHPKHGIYLTGSPGIRTPVSSAEEALELIEKGNRLRATATTSLNDRSSRSHTVISLEIITKDLSSEGKCATISIGKLNIVDLAGSERVKVSGASGQVLDEAKQINKALAALGDVLNSLGKFHQSLSSASTLDAPQPHIPYRNSKLTMLLKDSLGGCAKTMMIATVRMSQRFHQQSLTALKYAARAKYIKNQPIPNLGFDGTQSSGPGSQFMSQTIAEVARLKVLLDERTKEYDSLKKKLAALEQESKANGSTESARKVEEEFRQQILELNSQNEESRRELQDHFRALLVNQEGQLARKIAESEALESKLKDQLSTIEILSKEKKIAHVNQHKANATVQELYRKITEAQSATMRLEEKNRLLQDELDASKSKKDVGGEEREKFLDAIKKLMESRQRNKSKIAAMESELSKVQDQLLKKNREMEQYRVSQGHEREANEKNFAKILSLLKRAEAKIRHLTQENQNLKTATPVMNFPTELVQEDSKCKSEVFNHAPFVELKIGESNMHEADVLVPAVSDEVRDTTELNATSAMSIMSSNEVRLDFKTDPETTNVLSGDSDSTPQILANLDGKVPLESPDAEREDSESDEKSVGQSYACSKRETYDEVSLIEVMKRDRLHVENVALRQKIRLMLQEEKFVVQQLHDRTKELDECRQQIFSLRHNNDADPSQILAMQLMHDNEKEFLEGKVIVATRRIEVLEDELGKLKRRNSELTVALERKNGVLHLEKSLSRTFKENLELARNEKADELMRAISLVKNHVEVGSERRNGVRVLSSDEPSLASGGTNFKSFFRTAENNLSVPKVAPPEIDITKKKDAIDDDDKSFSSENGSLISELEGEGGVNGDNAW